MYWQEACNKSKDKIAIRFDPWHNRNICRQIDGISYYHNRIGELWFLDGAQVEGFDDWEPNRPKEAKDEQR